MANTPTITSPVDNSTQTLPFPLVGTGDVNALVEARADNGFLLPATQNPVTVDGNGDWTITVTSLTASGTGNKGYAAAGGEIYNAPSLVLEGSWGGALTSDVATCTATITTAASSLLVAMMSSKGSNSNAMPLLSVAGGSGTHTTAWTRIAGASMNSTNCPGNYGSEGIDTWYCVTSQAQASQVITATFDNALTMYAGLLTVWSFTGAAASPIGASTVFWSGDAFDPATTSLTPQASGSIVLVGVYRTGSATVLANGTFNATLDQSREDNGNGLKFIATHGTTTNTSQITIGSTTTGITRGGIAGVEIKAS